MVSLIITAVILAAIVAGVFWLLTARFGLIALIVAALLFVGLWWNGSIGPVPLPVVLGLGNPPVAAQPSVQCDLGFTVRNGACYQNTPVPTSAPVAAPTAAPAAAAPQATATPVPIYVPPVAAPPVVQQPPVAPPITAPAPTTGQAPVPVVTGQSFNPELFDKDSCPPEVTAGCSYDVGIKGVGTGFVGQQVVQVGIVKGVSIRWDKGGKVANPSSNNRCSLVVLTPNSWFENLRIVDGRFEVYNVWPGDIAGWTKTLAVQAAFEQQSDYGCPAKTIDQIEQWGSPIQSPPCGTPGFANCGGAVTTTTSPQTASQSAPATQPQVAVPANQAPASQTQQSGPLQLDSTGKHNLACPQLDTVDCQPRMASADNGGSVNFKAGDPVNGDKITINGRTVGGCHYAHAPGDGTVVNGVAHPWVTEVPPAKSYPPCP